MGLKIIPSGFLSLATKNLEPHKKVIRIKVTTQHKNRKVPSVVNSHTVPGTGDVSVASTRLHQCRFFLVVGICQSMS